MPTGTDYLNEIAASNHPSDWDAVTQRYLMLGAVPSWLMTSTTWPTVRAAITGPDGASHTLLYRVAPDFFGVGTDEDFVLTPMTPAFAQYVATARSAILPTRRMVQAIFAAASQRLPLSDVKAPPYNIPLGQIESPAAIAAARTRDRTQYNAPPTGGIVDGHRKDIVIGPGLDGSHVAIYGGQGGSVDGHFWQPYSTIHDASYADYSHGTRLVARDAILDGASVDLASVFQDPTLSLLVSDQGPFFPSFPSAGIGSSPAFAHASVDHGGTSGSSDFTDLGSAWDVNHVNQAVSDVAPSATFGKTLLIGGGILGFLYWMWTRSRS